MPTHLAGGTVWPLAWPRPARSCDLSPASWGILWRFRRSITSNGRTNTENVFEKRFPRQRRERAYEAKIKGSVGKSVGIARKVNHMKTITGEWLRLHGACESQVRVVEATWPQGAELTEANLRIAAELSLDLDWLASHVLEASAWARYEAEVAPALARFEAERAPALARYEAERAPALARFKAERASALARFKAEKASALWNALERQFGTSRN